MSRHSKVRVVRTGTTLAQGHENIAPRATGVSHADMNRIRIHAEANNGKKLCRSLDSETTRTTCVLYETKLLPQAALSKGLQFVRGSRILQG